MTGKIRSGRGRLEPATWAVLLAAGVIGGASALVGAEADPATRKEAIAQAIARIDAELKEYGNGTWDGWAESLKPFRESLKANRPPTRGFRFSKQGREMLLANRLQDLPECAKAFEAIVHTSAQFKKIGIDVLVVFIPNKIAVYPDYAADQAPEHRMVMPAEKRFIRELLEKDVEVVDLYTAFRDARREKGDRAPLYYDNDIHWRNAGARIAAEEISKRLKRYPFVQAALAQPRKFEARPGDRGGKNPDKVDFVYQAGTDRPYLDVFDSPVMLTGDSYSQYNWRCNDGVNPQGHFPAHVGLRINLPLTFVATAGLWDDMPEAVSGMDAGTHAKFTGHAGVLKPCKVIVWTFVARAMCSGRPWAKFDLPQAAGK
jgi:hypothetical protein